MTATPVNNLMTAVVGPFAEAPRAKALYCFFFSYERYLDLAVSHGMAINLKANDLRRAYDQGQFPEQGWEVKARLRADNHAKELKAGIRSAFATTVAFASAGLVLASILGKVHPGLPIDWAKVLSVLGGLVAAWATLFEIGSYEETWRGEALHEVLRPVFFRSAFLSGLIVATAGQLW